VTTPRPVVGNPPHAVTVVFLGGRYRGQSHASCECGWATVNISRPLIESEIAAHHVANAATDT
jgi:hypothetical protein